MELKRSAASRQLKFMAVVAMVTTFLWPMVCRAQQVDSRLAGRNDCDRKTFQEILQPIAQSTRSDARAVWLNARLIKWPGAEKSAAFRLYYSAQARIDRSNPTEIRGADGSIALHGFVDAPPSEAANRFKYVGEGATLSVDDADMHRLRGLHKQQLVLAQEDAEGKVIQATAIQSAGALDDLYSTAARAADLGVSVVPGGTHFRLWAPTARQVSLCVFASGDGPSRQLIRMQQDADSGMWSAASPADLSGKYYTYLVDVFTPESGVVRNRVTDPYTISLTTNSTRSYVASLGQRSLKPSGWERNRSPDRIAAQTDMVIYELHVRDFSVNDPSVAPAYRGKYLAFTQGESNGMKHLKALSRAGLTDIHLLPVFDFATVPERGCVSPDLSKTDQAPDSEAPQQIIDAQRETDCFNWGYDPFHYTAPEGSYATRAANGARRIIEFRQMVMALHNAGLRVGMDVVYNHVSASGQQEKSVLDRIVPGYYHRLNSEGVVEHSTCCENTATENTMMAKLMIDSVVTWAREYKIESFRFDLMGHQPRAVMEELKGRLKMATGRDIPLIGEGWNFGEVADGVRFEQASQLSLNGSGIGTFNDRLRDAVRGGGAGDSGVNMIKRQGYVNGLAYDPNAMAPAQPLNELQKAADMIRSGMAGSIRHYRMENFHGTVVELKDIDYGGQPAGYASQPGEVVNYVENHDNQTLFDNNVLKLPGSTTREDRARVQILALAINAFSQGIAYFHAGVDLLRSKSLDRNSFDSGDWFNRIDWRAKDNYFGAGLPPRRDNGADYSLLKPLLANRAIKPASAEMAWTRDAFLDLLRIRSSTSLFRLRTADEIRRRLVFFNTGPGQVATVLAGHLDGDGYAGANFRELIYLINVDVASHRIAVPPTRGKKYELHPVHIGATAADKRIAAEARFDGVAGTFDIPARSAAVFVVK